MKSSTKWGLRWTGVFMAFGLFMPGLLYLSIKLLVDEVVPEIPFTVAGSSSRGQYLLFVTALGLIPYILLSGICLLAARRLPPQRLAIVALGGLAGIVLPTFSAHVSVWYPMLSEGDGSFGSVILFLALPLITTATMAGAVVFFWFLSGLEYFRS